MKIVNAEEKHILAIRDIYAHHVLHGTGSFETDPPDAHEMLARLEKSATSGCRGSSLCRKIRSSGIATSPATASAMPTAIPLRIRFILLQRLSVRV